MRVSIYKTGIYLMLVSLIQTIKVTTSQHPWDLGQGVVQGRFQGICRCYFLGTFLGQFLGQGPKYVETLSMYCTNYWTIYLILVYLLEFEIIF